MILALITIVYIFAKNRAAFGEIELSREYKTKHLSERSQQIFDYYLEAFSQEDYQTDCDDFSSPFGTNITFAFLPVLPCVYGYLAARIRCCSSGLKCCSWEVVVLGKLSVHSLSFRHAWLGNSPYFF